MENPTGFDLNAAIRSWREKLSQSPRLRPENLGELESHLRDSVDLLHKKGLSVDEAFFVAARRLGDATILETEFAKVNQKELWLDRLLWMLAGLLMWRGLGICAEGLTEGAMTLGLLTFGLKTFQWKTIVPIGIIMGICQVALFAFGALGAAWLVRRKGAALSQTAAYVVQRRGRMALALIVICLALIIGQFVSRTASVYLAFHFGNNAAGIAGACKSVAFVLTEPMKIGAIVITALLLIRRRLRPAVKA